MTTPTALYQQAYPAQTVRFDGQSYLAHRLQVPEGRDAASVICEHRRTEGDVYILQNGKGVRADGCRSVYFATHEDNQLWVGFKAGHDMPFAVPSVMAGSLVATALAAAGDDIHGGVIVYGYSSKPVTLIEAVGAALRFCRVV